MVRIALVSIFSVAMMAVVDGIINPGYGVKSLVKVGLFLLLPLVANAMGEKKDLRGLLKPSSRRELARSLTLGVGVYLVIIITYLVLVDYLDLDAIKAALENNLGVTSENFIYVAIYISFANSLLEEFFFRGYVFLGLFEWTGRLKAYLLSAAIFAIYHVAIIGSWFHPAVFFLAMAGLFTGGMIFNYLNEKNGNILNSWIVHMMANLAINTIGLWMFDIL